jgi:hypothetical protein
MGEELQESGVAGVQEELIGFVTSRWKKRGVVGPIS